MNWETHTLDFKSANLFKVALTTWPDAERKRGERREGEAHQVNGLEVPVRSVADHLVHLIFRRAAQSIPLIGKLIILSGNIVN